MQLPQIRGYLYIDNVLMGVFSANLGKMGVDWFLFVWVWLFHFRKYQSILTWF